VDHTHLLTKTIKLGLDQIQNLLVAAGRSPMPTISHPPWITPPATSIG
jgi:hypothetical protein